ncbi:MAG TPA: fused MFS/spermidine synthase [Polyangiaceae bacterium]|nr:fused MFS/spermidine synthase [Polyangiaceae bacterium]
MRARDLGVTLLFFLSGTSGLVFEVVWLRYLTLVVGHTTFAASVVVSGFLGGLALGSYVFGRLAGRVSRPLRAYAALELATGLSALVFTLLLRDASRLAAVLGVPGGGPLAVRVLLAIALVAPPAFVMGGTLPLLTRFVARELPEVGRRFGLLYGVNTLGAAAGAALAGVWVIGAYGVWRAAAAAAGVNLLVAAVSFALSRAVERQAPEPDGAPETAEDPTETAKTDAPPLDRAGRLLVAAFAVAGFTSIGYEVLWFRVIGMFVHSTSYAFSMSLVAFLLGLVLGALLYSTRLAGRYRDLDIFATAQLLLAFLGLLSMVLLGHSGALGEGLRALLPGEGTHIARMLLHAAIVMLVPSTVIGVVFPCVVQLTTTHLRAAGRTVGLLYSVNTLGGIAGSFVVGFVAIPLAGTQWSFVAMAAANAVVAALLVRSDAGTEARVKARTYVASLALVPLSLLAVPPGWLVGQWLRGTPGTPLDVKEGRDGVVAVLSHSYEEDCKGKPDCPAECAAKPWSFRQLKFGSVSYATTSVLGRRYMTTLANLPMLTHPAPRDALLVCFGTGTTAGTFAGYSELGSLTIVDVSPEVFAAAPYFESENHGVLQDPRTKTALDDGRHFLAAHPEARFDVISFEPPPPISAGTVSLYTRELYALMAARLRPGGLVTQWIPMQEQSDTQNRMLVRSMLDAFTDVSLWMPSMNEAVLLASSEPVTLDLARWRARWEEPRVRDTLARSGFSGPAALLGTFVADRAALDRYAAGHAAVTDDLPVVEYPLQRRTPAFDVATLYADHASPLDHAVSVRDDERARLPAERAASERMALAAREHFAGRRGAATALVREAEALAGPTAYTELFGHSLYPCVLRAER